MFGLFNCEGGGGGAGRMMKGNKTVQMSVNF